MLVVNETLKPILDRVFIKPTPEANKTSGGLFIPEQNKPTPQIGEIVATGPGLPNELTGELRSLQLRPGDKVIYGALVGVPITYKGEEFLMMNECDVEAVIG